MDVRGLLKGAMKLWMAMVNWFLENGIGWMRRMLSEAKLKIILTVLVVVVSIGGSFAAGYGYRGIFPPRKKDCGARAPKMERSWLPKRWPWSMCVVRCTPMQQNTRESPCVCL